MPINIFVGIRQVGEHFYEDGILRPLFKRHNKVTKDQCKCPGSVRRGTPGVGVILYYGFNNRRCAGKPGRFILWILTKKQMEVLYCHELFIFRKILRFMPVSWVCEYSIVKGFVCTLLVYLRKCRSLLSFFFVSFCSTHFFFWNQTVWKHWCIISVSLKITCNLGCEMCTISEYMYAIIHVHIGEKYIQCGPSMTF